MICVHCSLYIEPAPVLPNGCRFRHQNGWRWCDFRQTSYAEPGEPEEVAA